MPTLQTMKDVVFSHSCEDWSRILAILMITRKAVKEVGSKFGIAPTRCSEAIFSKWLDHEEGTGAKERKWETVLTALDVGKNVTAVVLDELNQILLKEHDSEEGLYVVNFQISL